MFTHSPFPLPYFYRECHQPLAAAAGYCPCTTDLVLLLSLITNLSTDHQGNSASVWHNTTGRRGGDGGCGSAPGRIYNVLTAHVAEATPAGLKRFIILQWCYAGHSPPARAWSKAKFTVLRIHRYFQKITTAHL